MVPVAAVTATATGASEGGVDSATARILAGSNSGANGIAASRALRKSHTKAAVEIELLRADREKRLEKKQRQEDRDRAREEEEDTFLDDLQWAVGELKVVVESSMCLGQLIVDKATSTRSVRERVDGSFGYCEGVENGGLYLGSMVRVWRVVGYTWVVW